MNADYYKEHLVLQNAYFLLL